MRVLIVANSGNSRVADALYQTIAFLDTTGIEHVDIDVSQLPPSEFAYSDEPLSTIHPGLEQPIDLAFTLGGDGTILHTARVSHRLGIPIMGINYGHLGFLANTCDSSLIQMLTVALSGEATVEERVNLCIDVICEGDEEEDEDALSEQKPRRFFAVNEIVIARGALGHIVNFDLEIAGDHVASMRGDGIIVATATGSTAYALSAGGPLVAPGFRGMLAVPLAPHTLVSRAVVTEHQDIIEITLPHVDKNRTEVSLFADGDALHFEHPVHKVIVRTGSQPTRLIRYRKGSFYEQIARTFF